jgi:hypothetical protein
MGLHLICDARSGFVDSVPTKAAGDTNDAEMYQEFSFGGTVPPRLHLGRL